MAKVEVFTLHNEILPHKMKQNKKGKENAQSITLCFWSGQILSLSPTDFSYP
jgi:hypothetical protein